jgi:hypothetical protein
MRIGAVTKFRLQLFFLLTKYKSLFYEKAPTTFVL